MIPWLQIDFYNFSNTGNFGRRQHLREFRNLADLNKHARAWVTHVAGVRIHCTIGQALIATERPLMQALPVMAPDLRAWHQPVAIGRPDTTEPLGKRLFKTQLQLIAELDSTWAGGSKVAEGPRMSTN